MSKLFKTKGAPREFTVSKNTAVTLAILVGIPAVWGYIDLVMAIGVFIFKTILGVG